MRASASFFVMTYAFVFAFGLPAQGQVYEFTADYCGACRSVAPVIAQLVSQGYPIEPIDVQARPELARHYGIDQIPCFLAVRDGQVVDRVVGATGREELMRLCELTRSASASTASNSDPVVRGQTTRPPRGRLRDRLKERQNANCHCVPGNCRCLYEEPIVDVATALEGEVPQRALPITPTDPIANARAATVRLRIEDESGHSYGTGTIIDVHDSEALVLTCGHIFRSSEGKGRIICELFCPNAPQPVEGNLVCYDIRRDVGLVSIKPGVPVCQVAVGGTGQRPKQGDPVFSLGCDRGNDPTVIRNKVLAVNRYHGPANLVVGGRPVDGRSGGGLFSSDGVLIGVCNAADQEEDEGLYAALGPIHAELDRGGLGFIYRAQQPALAVRADHNTSTLGDNVRAPSMSPSPNALAPSETASANSVEAPAQPQGVPISREATPDLLPQYSQPNESVRAAPVTAPASAGGDAELICVIRDGKEVGGRSRLFVIDRPSSELVQRLSQEVNRRGPHLATQMHQTREPGVDVTANGWRSMAGRPGAK